MMLHVAQERRLGNTARDLDCLLGAVQLRLVHVLVCTVQSLLGATGLEPVDVVLD
jgi:hypothetical protein